MTSSNKSPAVTAILAVYNSEETVVAAVTTLLTQSVDTEVIVVDDGSSDNTLELLKQIPSIKLYKRQHEGPAKARNYGVTRASGDIVLFVDADMTFDRDYVQTLIAPISSEKVIGTYTVEERVSNWDNVWARCWNIQEGWEDRKRFPKNPHKYGTDFRAILKSEFERVGGFDDIGYTDTWSLFNKLGVRPLSTKAICYHKNPSTLSAVYRQARWLAKRPYKYGLLGTLYALARTSLPVSVVAGLIWAYKEPSLPAQASFVIFKIVYDLGRFVGILNMLTTGKLSK